MDVVIRISDRENGRVLVDFDPGGAMELDSIAQRVGYIAFHAIISGEIAKFAGSGLKVIEQAEDGRIWWGMQGEELGDD